MPLKGRAKKLYQREYMRRRRAALRMDAEPVHPPSTPASAPPDLLIAVKAALDEVGAGQPEPKRCSFCNKLASKPERIVIQIQSDDGKVRVRICETCHADAGALFAAQRYAWGRPPPCADVDLP
jgi:hypothetical protein